MEVTKLTQESFDIVSVRNAFLKQKGADLSVDHGTANTMSRAKYEDLFSLVQYGTEIFDARLFSPEVLWNDVKLLLVPSNWPEPNTINRGTPEAPDIQPMIMGEYTRIVRSLTDPTKAMVKYAQAKSPPLEYVDQQTLKSGNWVPVSHNLLMLFYNLFSGFSTRNEAIAWKDINVPT